MHTYAIPLSSFPAGVDVSSIKAVRLLFDKKRSGQVFVDDIGITR